MEKAGGVFFGRDREGGWDMTGPGLFWVGEKQDKTGNNNLRGCTHTTHNARAHTYTHAYAYTRSYI